MNRNQEKLKNLSHSNPCNFFFPFFYSELAVFYGNNTWAYRLTYSLVSTTENFAMSEKRCKSLHTNNVQEMICRPLDSFMIK